MRERGARQVERSEGRRRPSDRYVLFLTTSLSRLDLDALRYTAVFPAHPAVAGHTSHRTVRDVELRAQKAEAREKQEKQAEEKRKGEIQVIELYKPLGPTVAWIVAADKRQ